MGIHNESLTYDRPLFKFMHKHVRGLKVRDRRHLGECSEISSGDRLASCNSPKRPATFLRRRRTCYPSGESLGIYPIISSLYSSSTVLVVICEFVPYSKLHDLEEWMIFVMAYSSMSRIY
jgi:hypothetical protein